MKLQSKYADLMLNLLVAVAISLVVNFSYVLLMLVDLNSDSQPRPSDQRAVERPDEGVLSVHPDGYGYLVYENGDSVYVPTRRMRWLEIAPGDRIVADLMPPRSEKAHPMLAEIRTRNGAEFDYSKLYNGPSKMTELLLQLFYYLVVSFVMLSILTSVRRNYSMSRFVRRCLWCCVAAAALYCVAPVTEWHTGRIGLNFMSGRMFDYMLLLKCSFAVVASMLYGRIYVLISQRQAVVVENERLKNENLTTRYNMLVGQINPHFFFNSLNSLAMLVREKHDQKALTYIDQLSYTFRYIIQNGQSMLMTLDEELKFLEAYSYLFKIRYADKLFFDIDVDEKYLGWKLPAFSLQPLIDNAVKHNSITRTKPFHISVRTEVEPQGSQTRTRTFDRHRAGEPAQPLESDHGQRHRNRRRRRHLLRAHAAAKSLRMMKALIIEDETAAARNLAAILRQTAPDVEIVATLESVEESVEWLRSNPHPDLLFMDIHLADGDSFRIFDAVEIAAPVIFTTAYDQYALEAFKVNSIDYLLKPLNASDVGRALAKLHRLTSVERSDYGSRVRTLAASRREEVFLVHVRDKIIPLHRSRIAYCYTSNEKVTAYGFDGAAYPLDKTLEALQGLLPESEFFRANRQFIVARQAVKEIAVWFGSRLTLHLTVETPERIVISKARVPEFKAWLRSLHPVE